MLKRNSRSIVQKSFHQNMKLTFISSDQYYSDLNRNICQKYFSGLRYKNKN